MEERNYFNLIFMDVQVSLPPLTTAPFEPIRMLTKDRCRI